MGSGNPLAPALHPARSRVSRVWLTPSAFPMREWLNIQALCSTSDSWRAESLISQAVLSHPERLDEPALANRLAIYG